MNTIGTDIGMRLRKIREFRNYTQEYIANQLNISQNAYSKMENGITPITTDRLERLANILDVPVDSVLSREPQIFNLDNNHIEKFYGHIEHLHEENKELLQITILEEQNAYLKEQNASLMRTIEALGKK